MEERDRREHTLSIFYIIVIFLLFLAYYEFMNKKFDEIEYGDEKEVRIRVKGRKYNVTRDIFIACTVFIVLLFFIQFILLIKAASRSAKINEKWWHSKIFWFKFSVFILLSIAIGAVLYPIYYFLENKEIKYDTKREGGDFYLKRKIYNLIKPFVLASAISFSVIWILTIVSNEISSGMKPEENINRPTPNNPSIQGK